MMENVFKIYLFLDGEKVVIKGRHDARTEGSKSTIVASVRKLKVADEIKSYEIRSDKNMTEYLIKLEEGTLSLRLSSTDPYNGSLKRILERKKIVEEVRIHVDEDQVRMTSNITDEEKNESFEDVVKLLKALENNGEIKSVIKSGDSNRPDSTLSYVFETKENEKIRIYVSTSNKKAISMLDQFHKTTIKKKTNLRKMAAIAAVGIALVAVPHVFSNIHFQMGQEATASENQIDVETNFTIMRSYIIRLSNEGLSVEEYFQLSSMVAETKSYYEELGKTDTESYKTLLEYEKLVDEYYQDYASKRGKTH